MNFGDIIENIRLRCGISATDDRMTAYIKSMVNAEYARLCAEYRLMDKVSSLALVKDSAVVDLPDDWQRTHQLTRAGSVMTPVTPLEYARFLTGADVPSVNAYMPESPERIRVWPVPDETEPQAVTIVYAARPLQMNADTDEPYAIPVAYRTLLASLGAYHVLIADGAADLAAAAQQEAAGMEMRMAGHVVAREGGGKDRIVPPPAMVQSWR